jgi:hypothetical protein
MTEKPAPLPAEKVKAFVVAGHHDLEGVRTMLVEQPGLVNAAWDWGGGDFETALGAAAHMGRADIARCLLESGARFDLYAAAMLGQLEAVRAVLEANPAARHTPGAHGIPLLVHAQQGGDAAQAVVDYLNSLG